MKKLLLSSIVLTVFITCYFIATNTPEPSAELVRFAIVSDRTAQARVGIFEKTVVKINRLHPDFVCSVGDFIEGYSSEDELINQWNEFDRIANKFDMKFYRTPGNHDVNTPVSIRLWKQHCGALYYSFVVKNVLFVILNSEELDGAFGDEQLRFVKSLLIKTYEHIFIFFHRPLWTDKDNTSFKRLDSLLENKKFTMFAGHEHEYSIITKGENKYITLATTGGMSPLRGVSYGEFDHFMWIVVSSNKIKFSNVLLDGPILDEYLK